MSNVQYPSNFTVLTNKRLTNKINLEVFKVTCFFFLI